MTDKTEFLEQAMEAAITRALEQRKEPAVPVDFAVRVRLALPPRPVARASAHVGRLMAMVAAVVLTIALFVLAPHAAPSFESVSFDVELMLLAELGGIAYWLVGQGLGVRG